MVTFDDLKSGKVKPEFGNMDHIRAIKAHEEALNRVNTMCGECGGEGTITCPCCDGSGEKPKPKKGK